MKSPFKLIPVLLFFSIFITSFISCKKGYSEIKIKDKISNQSSSENLKNYMAELFQTSSEYISYDAKTDSFSFRGIPQISKSELSKIYSNKSK